jgi:hypothetical protein
MARTVRVPHDDTKRRGVFLSARWLHVAMLNWRVDAERIAPHVPRGTELDDFGGHHYVSVVGLLFDHTRLLGLPIPGHRRFEELNLRIYVRRREGDELRRGVVFIKELVPRWAVARVARWFYNENYDSLPMRHGLQSENGNSPDATHRLFYEWRVGTRWNSLRMVVHGSPTPSATGSHEEFITEHYWGYTRQRDGGTIEYRVEHPRWNVSPAHSFALDCDAERLYGSEWAEVLARTPDSALLADGSEVWVYRPRRIA